MNEKRGHFGIIQIGWSGWCTRWHGVEDAAEDTSADATHLGCGDQDRPRDLVSEKVESNSERVEWTSHGSRCRNVYRAVLWVASDLCERT